MGLYWLQVMQARVAYGGGYINAVDRRLSAQVSAPWDVQEVFASLTYFRRIAREPLSGHSAVGHLVDAHASLRAPWLMNCRQGCAAASADEFSRALCNDKIVSPATSRNQRTV